jgi:hypothetical protein
MTEKVAELLKRAMELPSEGRAAPASWLLASLDQDLSMKERNEWSGRSLDVWNASEPGQNCGDRAWTAAS